MTEWIGKRVVLVLFDESWVTGVLLKNEGNVAVLQDAIDLESGTEWFEKAVFSFVIMVEAEQCARN